MSELIQYNMIKISHTYYKLCKYTEYVHTSGKLLLLKISSHIYKVNNINNRTELKLKIKGDCIEKKQHRVPWVAQSVLS